MSKCVESSLLVIIIDTNPAQKLACESSAFVKCVESVVSFANSHLMLKPVNKLAILGCDDTNIQFLFPYPGSSNDQQTLTRQHDGQYEVFTNVEKTVRENLEKMIASTVDKVNAIEANFRAKFSKSDGQATTSERTYGLESLGGETVLSGALAKAMCYIHRLERELPPGHAMNSRILIVTGSGETSSQYMNLMNIFFSAQRKGVVIDVCALEEDLGLLQQGCDITSGLYLRVPQKQGLLQYLLWVFLPEPPIRNKLVLPPRVKVDYRAACFCHRELIEIGFVCSVCLSIFCKFSPICTTCQTVFKNQAALPLKQKKKKVIKIS